MHYTFTDRKGRTIVLEAIENGKFKIYDNTIGVMTNSPIYSHHIDNLKWYISNSLELQTGRKDIGLKKIEKMVIDGIEVKGNKNAKTYLRSNVFPGSYTSYDRFIRLAVLKFLNNSGNTIDDDKMLITGSKILNSVVVPRTKGYFYYNYLLEEEKEEEKHKKIKHSINGNILYGGGDDYTQYEIMYNLNKLEMYIKRENSINWKRHKIKF